MTSPGAKRMPDISESQTKRRCLTPSIRNYFAPASLSHHTRNQSPANVATPLRECADATTDANKKAFDTPTKSKLTETPTTPTRTRPAADPESPLTPQISRSLRLQATPKTPATPRTPTIPRTPATPQQERVEFSKDNEENYAHCNYDFLRPPKRRDINKRAPEDPNYDEKTLYLSDSFLDSQTPALRQWWLVKQKNMDAILFFKMGKFYELFNEDAVVGVNELGIQYMKSDDGKPAHAGFPESSFDKYANKLIERNYKVMRIEQTETPAMMEERCQRTGRRGKFDKVVKREVCQVTTRGTMMLGICDSTFHSMQNQFLLALCESTIDCSSPRQRVFGVCFVDVTTGVLHIGQFEDDNNLSNLNILLAHHTPSEILHERGNLSQHAMQALLKTGAMLSPLKPTKEFWPIKRTLSHLKTRHIFVNEEGKFEWPALLKSLFEADTSAGAENLLNVEPREEYKYALSSFGAIVFYLNSQLIENQVLRCTSFKLYINPLSTHNGNVSRGKDTAAMMQAPYSSPMIVDHIALKNLEIFSDSTDSGSTLFNSINYCKTHFGQRLLKNWLCSPLRNVDSIQKRLNMVEDLTDNRNASLMNEIVHTLSQTPDLERMLTRIKSQCYKSESDSRAIMFDGNQHSKAKISSFLNLLNNFKRLQKFIVSMSRSVQGCKSIELKRLLNFTIDDGLFPDYSATLDYFETAFDHKAAQQTGKIIPSHGVDPEYDECEANIEEMETKLQDYLESQKEVLKCRQIEFFGTAKNRYQIQVPDAYCKNVPSEYRIETTRKGVKRYYTTTIDKYFTKLTTYEEKLKKILDNIMSKIFEQFTRQMNLWSAAIECVAILDVIQSLANFSRSLKANGVDICRPEFEDCCDRPLIDYVQGRHPALVKSNPNYIANNLCLDDKLILLTGANMGGKSTLMRQTALLVILAQIGSYVPAKTFRLTPVDRIFSRLGASDKLLEGESTFYTELVETSAMLRFATRDSLLLIDELGRGTSTHDGTAIAYSVAREISTNLKCRCIFSTHYHSLIKDFANSEIIRLAHMACRIERDNNDDELDTDPLKENISFLYKITVGPAARSYGFNVAKLAGISDDIIKEAFVKAKEFELGCKVVSALQKICQSSPKAASDGSLKANVIAALKG